MSDDPREQFIQLPAFPPELIAREIAFKGRMDRYKTMSFNSGSSVNEAMQWLIEQVENLRKEVTLDHYVRQLAAELLEESEKGPVEAAKIVKLVRLVAGKEKA